MNLTVDTLKKTIDTLGYKWYYDRPNIIGIRTNLVIPDVFNDVICVIYYENGKEVMKSFAGTTVPGVHYQLQPLNSKGCAVLKPGQYVDAYSLGFHQGRSTHKALVQTGKVTVYRDNDKDGIAEEIGPEDVGLHGINIHGASNRIISKKIGEWSAGCQVIAAWSNKEDLMNVCENHKTASKNKFTYTLLREKELCQD